jgi:ribose-phosphate pyrophosphokinase
MCDVLGQETIVICALDKPDSKLLPLFFFLRNLQDMGAGKVTLIVPYLPYMRQDKQFNPGEAVTARYFAQIISLCADELITIDPHLHRFKSAEEIYSLQCAVLPSSSLVTEYIRKQINNPLIIGPDSESNQWVSSIAGQLNAPFVVLHKKRMSDRDVIVSELQIGSAEKFTPIIVDDIISTAHTMIETVKAVKKSGLKDPVCIGIHALFVESAYEELKRSGVSDIVTTNTILHESNRMDISDLIASAFKK